MSFSPECWQPLGPARPPTGQQLPAYCKPVGRGGHKQAKQFKPGQSRGRFAKFTHALQKLQVISRISSCSCETNVLECGQRLLRSYMLGKRLTGGLVAHTPRLADGAYGTARCCETLPFRFGVCLNKTEHSWSCPWTSTCLAKRSSSCKWLPLGAR